MTKVLIASSILATYIKNILVYISVKFYKVYGLYGRSLYWPEFLEREPARSYFHSSWLGPSKNKPNQVRPDSISTKNSGFSYHTNKIIWKNTE